MSFKKNISEINVRSESHKEEKIEGACDYKHICWRKKNAPSGHHTSHPHNVRQIPSLALSWGCLAHADHPSSTFAAPSTWRGRPSCFSCPICSWYQALCGPLRQGQVSSCWS